MTQQEWPTLRKNVLQMLGFMDGLIQSTNNADINGARETFRTFIQPFMDTTIKELRRIAFCYYTIAENIQQRAVWQIDPVQDVDHEELDIIEELLQGNLGYQNPDLIREFSNNIDLLNNREKMEKKKVTYQLTVEAKEVLTKVL